MKLGLESLKPVVVAEEVEPQMDLNDPELLQEFFEAEKEVDAQLLAERDNDYLVDNLKSIAAVARVHGATESLLAAVNEGNQLGGLLGLDLEKVEDPKAMGETLAAAIESNVEDMDLMLAAEVEAAMEAYVTEFDRKKAAKEAAANGKLAKAKQFVADKAKALKEGAGKAKDYVVEKVAGAWKKLSERTAPMFENLAGKVKNMPGYERLSGMGSWIQKRWTDLSKRSKIAIPVAAVVTALGMIVFIRKWFSRAAAIVKGLEGVAQGQDAEAFAKIKANFAPADKFEAHLKAVQALASYLETTGKAEGFSADAKKIEELVGAASFKYEAVTMGEAGWDLAKFHKAVGETTAMLKGAMGFAETLAAAGKKANEAITKLATEVPGDDAKAEADFAAIKAGLAAYKSATKQLFMVAHNDGMKVLAVAKKVK